MMSKEMQGVTKLEEADGRRKLTGGTAQGAGACAGRAKKEAKQGTA